jgi:hypothetical protein
MVLGMGASILIAGRGHDGAPFILSDMSGSQPKILFSYIYPFLLENKWKAMQFKMLRNELRSEFF